jgi:hypothetical protein
MFLGMLAPMTQSFASISGRLPQQTDDFEQVSIDGRVTPLEKIIVPTVRIVNIGAYRFRPDPQQRDTHRTISDPPPRVNELSWFEHDDEIGFKQRSTVVNTGSMLRQIDISPPRVSYCRRISGRSFRSLEAA